jgi:hypothetical protein
MASSYWWEAVYDNGLPGCEVTPIDGGSCLFYALDIVSGNGQHIMTCATHRATAERLAGGSVLRRFRRG